MPSLMRGMPSWRPPASWRRIGAIESHAAGEPLRVIVEGLDPIPGGTILEKRRFAQERLDGLRRGLMFEPRGHADMYGAIPTVPVTPDGDLGVLFLHNEGWSTMCGHGVIALVTVALEAGLLPAKREVRLDTPAGRVTARPRQEGPRVRSVAFENVPSFVVSLEDAVAVSGFGEVRYDLAFGGAFYAFVDAASIGLALTPERFLYGTIFTGPAMTVGADSRNVCVFAEGEVDRSPTGTGVSARVAIERARGRLAAGAPFVVESIIGTRFAGRSVRELRWEGYDAVVPEVEGSAWITGRTELYFAPDDPLLDGFILR